MRFPTNLKLSLFQSVSGRRKSMRSKYLHS